MKKFYFLLLLVIGFINLSAQIIVNGETSSQIKNHFQKSTLGDCDTIFSFTTIDDKPVGLASNGNFLYTNAQTSDSIYKFNLDGQLLKSIPSPASSFLSHGSDLDFDGTFLWVVVEQEAKLYKIDTSNGVIINSFSLPSSDSTDPDNFGCAHDNGYIWITEYFDETLMRIDTTTGHVVDSFAINRRVLPLKIINNELYGIEFVDKTPDGQMQLVKFDRANGNIIDSLPWCLPYSLGLCWAEEHLWGLSSRTLFGYGNKRIYEFDSLLVSTNNIFPLTNSISVFPNPATTKFSISGLINIEKVEIFNMNGTKIFKKDSFKQNISNEIDCSNFQKGIYILKIFNREKTYNEKIVIQ